MDNQALIHECYREMNQGKPSDPLVQGVQEVLAGCEALGLKPVRLQSSAARSICIVLNDTGVYTDIEVEDDGSMSAVVSGQGDIITFPVSPEPDEVRNALNKLKDFAEAREAAA